MADYEYRPVVRSREADGPWSKWRPIYTSRGKFRPYRTIGAARGVLSREKKADALQQRRHRELDKLGGRAFPVVSYEYKIQRRPFGEWEDMP